MAQPKLNDETVYLVDGSGYIFRAYYAIRHLQSKKGVPTNAVFGFTNMLVKLLREHDPKYIGIAFDRKEPTFRHQIYEGYKANRPAPPQDLIPQFDLIHQVVKAFSIKLLSMAGFEADDLIGTLARQAREQGREVVIVTGDKDFMQLVDEHTFLLDELRAIKNGAERFIDREQVISELGVAPERVVDLLALAGDASDNVPGISGIGKKTAADLINEFGPVEKLLELAPLIKQKSRREKLMDGYKDALLSKQLVTIDRYAPLLCSIEDLRYEGIREQEARALFEELDFTRLLSEKILFKGDSARLGLSTPMESVIDRSHYRSITSMAELDEVMEEVAQVKKIAISAKTDNLDSNTANLIGISLAWGERAAYIPLAHSGSEAVHQLERGTVKDAIAKILTDRDKTVVAQNAKYDYKVFCRHGFEFRIGGDPMLQSYLLHQDHERHGLDDLSQKYLGHRAMGYEEISGEKKNQIPFSRISIRAATEYAAEGADLALRLENLLLTQIESHDLLKLYRDLELPLEEVLGRMELTGVRLDIEKLDRVGRELRDRLAELLGQARKAADCPTFNPASPRQVAEILFDKLSLPSVKKLKTGHSTDSSVLERLAPLHPLPRILLDHRMVAKLLNTYVEALPSLIDKSTGRLHTNYNQFITATGRLSSSDPNLQNIPARTREGRRIREAFVAERGYKLISLDYSQVELRILAHVSRDPVLLDSFAKKEDVHSRTASEIFDVDQEMVTKEQRNAAKTINFGILYGMGSHRLAQTLKIPRGDAAGYLQRYHKKYAGVFAWKTSCLAMARDRGEVRTLFGRRRSLPELFSKSAVEQARGERIAINTPIQGTAADLIKKAMIDADAYLQKKGLDAQLIMQVHDELVIEARESEALEIAHDIAEIMATGHGLELDLKVDFGIADNWSDAH